MQCSILCALPGAHRWPGRVSGHGWATRRIRVSAKKGSPLDVVHPQVLAVAHPRALQPYRRAPQHLKIAHTAHMPMHTPPGRGARPACRPGALVGDRDGSLFWGLRLHTLSPCTRGYVQETATTFHQRRQTPCRSQRAPAVPRLRRRRRRRLGFTRGGRPGRRDGFVL